MNNKLKMALVGLGVVAALAIACSLIRWQKKQSEAKEAAVEQSAAAPAPEVAPPAKKEAKKEKK